MIVKYKNRKLYNQTTSSYVNLTDIIAMIKSGENVRVLDITTNTDITNTVLKAALKSQLTSVALNNTELTTLIKSY